MGEADSLYSKTGRKADEPDTALYMGRWILSEEHDVLIVSR
jgi:hypothetical protein